MGGREGLAAGLATLNNGGGPVLGAGPRSVRTLIPGPRILTSSTGLLLAGTLVMLTTAGISPLGESSGPGEVAMLPCTVPGTITGSWGISPSSSSSSIPGWRLVLAMADAQPPLPHSPDYSGHVAEPPRRPRWLHPAAPRSKGLTRLAAVPPLGTSPCRPEPPNPRRSPAAHPEPERLRGTHLDQPLNTTELQLRCPATATWWLPTWLAVDDAGWWRRAWVHLLPPHLPPKAGQSSS